MKIATPSLSFRLSVIERLLRCRFWKSGPWRGPPMVSLSTLGGVSILITSAPKSASWRTQVGPARTRERSRTRKRASAVEAGKGGLGKGGVGGGGVPLHKRYGRETKGHSPQETLLKPRRR